MATKDKQALNELRRLAECCICLKPFTDPRMLPCTHSACLKCFEDIQTKNKKKPGDVIPCPVCRKEFPIPSKGMIGLQKNVFIAHMMETVQNFSEENKLQRCKMCKIIDATKDADEVTMKCLECLQTFCERCANVHRFNDLTQRHRIVGMKIKDCIDFTTVEAEFRKILETNSSDISHYMAKLEGKRSDMEKKKTNILDQTSAIENEIRLKNQQLKAQIDQQIRLVLEELSSMKQKLFKDVESEIEEIERMMTILKSFEAYCSELKSKGPSIDVCSCVAELIQKAEELKKENDEYLNSPDCVVEVKFNATDEEVLRRSSSNVLGNIEESTKRVKRYAVVIGGHAGQLLVKDVTKINLHKTGDASDLQPMPTEMINECASALYHNSIYVTGLGKHNEEIWKFDATSDKWRECSSMVKGRRRHCVAFVGQLLYICGGYVDSDKSVLDNVEAYDAIKDRCSSVGKLVHCVQNSGNCVPFNSSLYIFGGINNNNTATSHVQVFNTKTNTCSLLSGQLPCAFNHMRAVLLEDTVILLGKYRCFLYNLQTRTWQRRPQLKTEVVNFGLVVDKGQLFVMGGAASKKSADGIVGWTYRNDVRCIPLKNIMKNETVEWRHHAKLPRKTAVYACDIIEFEV